LHELAAQSAFSAVFYDARHWNSRCPYQLT
jgi:hypothetical protein